MHLKVYIFTFSILIFAANIFAQTTLNIDSLKSAVEKMPDDSVKVTVYYKIAVGLLRTNPEEMHKYAEKALKLADELDIKTEIAKSYHVLGIFYAERGDLKRSLEYFFKSLETLERIGDESRKGVALGAIARIYQLLENNEKALEYDLKALTIALNNKDSANLATNYNNVGADYNNLKKYDKAIKNYNNALVLAKKNKNIQLQALLLLNIGYAYQKTNDFQSAFKNLKEAQKLYTEINDKYGLANTYNKLAGYFNENQINDSTIKYASNALSLSENIGTFTIIRQASGLLSEAYEKTEMYDSAFKYLRQFNTMNDSIINSGNTKKITQLEMNYEFEKEREISKIKHKEEVRRQQNFTIFFITAFLLSLLLVILIFRNYRLKKKSEKKLQQLNAVKDRFFKIISHDLKAPFTAFISISEILSNSEINLSKEKIQYFANSINTTAKSSYDLFQNLLLWSMSQRENLKINKVEIDLIKLISDTVTLLKAAADDKDIEIITKIATDIKVLTDENITKTILRNLINNAIKFTPSGGKITISANSDDNYTEISVTDTGIGISKENLSKLFKPEVHHSTSGTNNEKGTGLGLILCKELIEKTGGTISVISEKDKGSHFIFTIPA
ncbi:MAG: tetratricopeptide repeat-containing sensor histidine kinase [Bacteroidales bacterium]|nr:tetratricopeptide repeat-containing sensor histidine kinase [Bacteroidales bacterium]